VRSIFNKKNIIISIIILALIFIVYFVFFRNKLDYGVRIQFDPNRPIIIEEDGEYGYITSTGKMMIEPQYEGAYGFYGDYAVVYDGDEYHIIDKKGKIKLSAEKSSDIIFISESGYWIVEDVLYNKKLKQVSDDKVEVSYSSSGYLIFKDSKNDEMGIMNSKGKVIYDTSMDEDESYISLSVSSNSYDLKDTYGKICIDGESCAVINVKNGKVIYDFTKDSITVGYNNVFSVKDKDSGKKVKSFYIEGNKIAYEVDEDIDLEYYTKDVLQLYDRSKDYSKRYSYYDLKEKDESSKAPDKVSSFEILTGYTINDCKSGSKFGIDKGEKEILACEYDNVKYLGSNLYKYLESKGKHYVFLEKDEDVILFNMKNKKIVETFEDVEQFKTSSNSTFVYYLTDEDELVIYNLLTRKSITFDADSYDDLELNSNYIVIEKDDTLYYYNTKLKLIYEQEM